MSWLRLMHNWLNAAPDAGHVVIGDPDGVHVKLDMPADAIGATVYRNGKPPGVFYPAQRDGEPA